MTTNTTSSADILAIDFGTSNSLVTAAGQGKVLEPLPLDPDAPDPTIIRSVLFTPEKGQWFFGQRAMNEYQAHFAHGRLLRSVKKYLPDPNFNGTQIHGSFVNLVEIIASFLRELRQRACTEMDRDVTRCILGRPALFSDNAQNDALAEKRLESAAKLAGFKEVHFLAEPVAAAFEFRQQLTEAKNVLVADFGGGTSDFTVLRLGPKELKAEDVLAIGGVSIAGDMFDGSIMRHMIAPYLGSEVEYRLPLGSNDMRLPISLINRLCSPADMALLARHDILSLLRDAQRWTVTPDNAKRMNRLFVLIEEHLGYAIFRSIESTKIALSSANSAQFVFDYPEVEIEEEVFSADFKAQSYGLVEKITKSLDDTVKASGLTFADIDITCCTGGTAKLPALQFELEKRFGKAKLQQHRNFHSVALGLAQKALTL